MFASALECADTVVTNLVGAFREAVAALLRAPVVDRIAVDDPRKLVTYLNFQMAALNREQLRLLFLDSNNGLIADEVMATGTVNAVPLYPREIIARALNHSATAIILVHNHPSRDPRPSRADIEGTRKVITACAAVDIAVHDHIIVSAGGWSSMRSAKLVPFSRTEQTG